MEGEKNQNKYAAKDSSDSDTIHVHIESQESLKSDLEYLAEKMGVDIEQLREERYQAEKQEKEAEINKRLEKKNKARIAREDALEKEFLDGYGFKDGHYGLTLNGRRIQKLKNFDEIVCPQCGVPLRLQGLATSIVEVGNRIMEHPLNPLSAFYFVQCRIQDVECQNKHVNKVIVQRIL